MSSVAQTDPKVNHNTAHGAPRAGGATRAFLRVFPNEARPTDLSRGTMPRRGEPVDLLSGDREPTGLVGIFVGCIRLEASLFFRVRVDGVEDVKRAVELYLRPDHAPDPEPVSPAVARRLADLQELAARYNRIAALAYDAGLTVNRAVLAEAAERRKGRLAAEAEAGRRRDVQHALRTLADREVKTADDRLELMAAFEAEHPDFRDRDTAHAARLFRSFLADRETATGKEAASGSDVG